ncbi:CPBP family intramembrane glutamic endopeptidase [Nocardia australiensis]|uniref:CPBP family intramembrane glutamic endopeptidase n=1 Tax=Nocardia australiensis TaxID=2887191 RepID=UPI001D13A7CB|nr:type II CAAX endopeptidase family protein [Nocardia australiensis]
MSVHDESDDARHPIRFLMLVTVLSLPFFVLGAVFGSLRVGAMELPASAAMFVLPVLAAAILTYRDSGWGGTVRLLRRIGDYSAAPRKFWYLVALLIPAVVALVSHGIARMSGQVGSTLPISPAALPVIVLAALFAAGCEELGWTGYATDPMQQRWGPARTGLILGTFWAVWHLIPLLQVDHGIGWIAGWFAGTVAARVLIVWLHNHTGHGILAAIVMHAMLNVTAALTPDYSKAISTVLAGLLMSAIALAVLVQTSRRIPNEQVASQHHSPEAGSR